MAKAIGLAAILLFGLVSSMYGLAAVLVIPSEDVPDFSFDRKRYFALQDAVPNSERTFGETEIPDHPPLQNWELHPVMQNVSFDQKRNLLPLLQKE